MTEANGIRYRGPAVVDIEVSSINCSVAWYAKHLGFTHSFGEDGHPHAEMNTHIEGLVLGMSPAAKPRVDGACTLVLGVEDLDSARMTLENAGVEFAGETEVIPEVLKLATFFDPDRNRLMLYQDMTS